MTQPRQEWTSLSKNRVAIIYHGNCPDGFGAAWLMYKYLRTRGFTDVQVISASYSKPAPQLDVNHVFLLDFCYSLHDLIRLDQNADTLTILDHHETALGWMKEFAGETGLPLVETWDEDLRGIFDIKVLDQSHSGAMLAQLWTTSYVRFVDNIEDRDLWRFALPETKNVMAAIMSYPYDMKVWDSLVNKGTQGLNTEGRSINRFRDNLIEQVVATAYQADVFDHEGIWICASPYAISSDVGAILAERDPERFACTYQDHGNDRRHWGLRSTKNGMNVAAIAETRGGGGHVAAAGCDTPMSYPSIS